MLESSTRAHQSTPSRARAFVEWTSDPAHPVPYTEETTTGTVAGPIVAKLWVSTSGTASDFVVKLVDVWADDAGAVKLPDGTEEPMGDYEMMVRSEVIRGRYREGYDRPRPFSPGRPTAVDVPLQPVLHTFGKGHRVMIQVQSTWFPLVDRNPNHYVTNVFEAEAKDYVKATQRVYCDRAHPTRVELGTLPRG